MASSTTPLLADNRPRSIDSTQDNEETALFSGIATTSPSRPFATSFYPTLFTRSIALILSLPAFIIFITQGPHYSPAIIFLSFAIARQIVLLGSYFGSQIIIIHIEFVHHKLKGASARAQEKWIKKSMAAAIDGGILVGMLVTLSLVAHEVDTCYYGCGYPAILTHAVILGFITFGLLLISVPDFGNPSLVTVMFAIEKPAAGLLKLATIVLCGEPEEEEENDVETHEHHRAGKRYSAIHGDDTV